MMAGSAVTPMGWAAFFLDAATRACEAETKRTGSLIVQPLYVVIPESIFHELLHELEDGWPAERTAAALAPWNECRVRAGRSGLEEPYPFLFIDGVVLALVPARGEACVLWSDGRIEEI